MSMKYLIEISQIGTLEYFIHIRGKLVAKIIKKTNC